MNLTVINHSLAVGSIQLGAVASAAIMQIGDTEQNIIFPVRYTAGVSYCRRPSATGSTGECRAGRRRRKWLTIPRAYQRLAGLNY